MTRILGISQVTFDDFLQALSSIKSIAIKNVDQMLYYAKHYGWSAKNGEDIAQMEQQSKTMKNTEGTSERTPERYRAIFQQYAEAIMEAYGNQ